MKQVFEYTEYDLMIADQRASTLGEEYKNYVFAKMMYEGVCKDYMAALKMEFRTEKDESEAKLESMVRASDDWKAFRKEKMAKLRDAGAAKIRYDNAIRHWESVRSCRSMRKKELERGL